MTDILDIDDRVRRGHALAAAQLRAEYSRQLRANCDDLRARSDCRNAGDADRSTGACARLRNPPHKGMTSMDTQALVKLWNLTQEHRGTSGARAAAGVLLGLYNGTRFPLDLTDLRVLDDEFLRAALAVIGAAARCQDVHDWLNHIAGRRDFGARFEHLAHAWKRKGRCKRERLEPVTPAHIVIRAQPDVPSIVRKAGDAAA